MKRRMHGNPWLGAILALAAAATGVGAAAGAVAAETVAAPAADTQQDRATTRSGQQTDQQSQADRYYQCGQTYYVQAYGGSGPIYMPVPPPQ